MASKKFEYFSINFLWLYVMNNTLLVMFLFFLHKVQTNWREKLSEMLSTFISYFQTTPNTTYQIHTYKTYSIHM